MSHPFTKYAEALVRVENGLTANDQITGDQLRHEIEKGLNSFRLSPSGVYQGKEKVSYTYLREAKGDTKSGIFLSPNIISSDKQAKNIWAESNQIGKRLEKGDLSKSDYIKMSIAPISGEFLSFSLSGSIGRGKPNATMQEIALNAVASLTTEKPSLQYRIDKKPRPELFNVCIIPDLPLEDLMDFIILYKKMKVSKSASDLFIGDVRLSKEGYEPKRPLIYRGNFPNPPRSSALGSVALLGTIGEFAKEAEVSTLAMKVLESLKGVNIYMIKYGGASTFTFDHHVVDLAKEGKLREIVDSVYYAQIYNEGRRKGQSTEYQKFDLFTCRFLQLFNRPAFRDFLSFRAECGIEIRHGRRVVRARIPSIVPMWN